jgi:hypothetical protein
MIHAWQNLLVFHTAVIIRVVRKSLTEFQSLSLLEGHVLHGLVSCSLRTIT